MTNDQLKEKLTALYPESVFDETGQWLTVSIAPEKWLEFATFLRNAQELFFDYLFCLTSVDWKTHLGMVYHLESKKHGHILVVKLKVDDRNNPEVETVSHIWRTAEFHEREAYDLFGMRFKNHPDLRRLFLTEEWEGWPLRKDYVDEVNMIKL